MNNTLQYALVNYKQFALLFVKVITLFYTILFPFVFVLFSIINETVLLRQQYADKNYFAV